MGKPGWIANDAVTRIGLAAAGAYCGQVIAMLVLTKGAGGWGMLSPAVGVGAALGALVTPGAGLLLLITGAGTAAYVVFRVPRWAVLGLVAGFAGVVFWTLRAWQAHAR